MMKKILPLIFPVYLAFSCTSVFAADAFSFNKITSIEAMHAFIDATIKPGDPRDKIEKIFATEGGAKTIAHPSNKHIEKYIYDINLCSYYIWRWNISADYDDNNKLTHIYVNGREKPISEKIPSELQPGKKGFIAKLQRPRPEAYKGEKSLGYLILDLDGNKDSAQDQFLVGAGPSQTNPANMGRMVVYTNIDPWRSIFDSDDADKIHDYDGGCKEADMMYEKAKASTAAAPR